MKPENIELLAIVILLVLLAVLGLTVVMMHKIAIRQEAEIHLYKMYTKPLEELIKEIRARQHEFDNHLNAILNLHLTIDNYDELVRAQSDYIFSIVDDKKNSFMPLLKISDKVLAGFLYTKMVNVKKHVDFEAEIGCGNIVTNTPEKYIIEVVGTLIDNAVDACDEENHKIKLFISSEGADTPTSEDDKLIVEVMNEHAPIPMSQMQHFFEKGWSTKSKEKNARGFGLYNAKRIISEHNGQITLENREIEGRNYIYFRVEL